MLWSLQATGLIRRLSDRRGAHACAQTHARTHRTQTLKDVLTNDIDHYGITFCLFMPVCVFVFVGADFSRCEVSIRLIF